MDPNTTTPITNNPVRSSSLQHKRSISQIETSTTNKSRPPSQTSQSQPPSRTHSRSSSTHRYINIYVKDPFQLSSLSSSIKIDNNSSLDNNYSIQHMNHLLYENIDDSEWDNYTNSSKIESKPLLFDSEYYGDQIKNDIRHSSSTQIEAEYAFKYGGIERVGSYEPLEVGLLYDVGMVALRFRDIVGEVLEHGDVVNVLNFYDGYSGLRDQLEDLEEHTSLEDSKDDSIWNPISERQIAEISELHPKEKRRYSMPIMLNRKRHSLTKNGQFQVDSSAPPVPPIPQVSPVSNQPSFINSSDKSTSPLLPTPSTSATQSSVDTLPSNPTALHIQNLIQASEARFQSILTNTLALNFFQRFTISEYSAENPLFWLDVELFAAGISSDDEDNYFDEQQTALIHAKYIYLTYISPNAPLQVNLSDEIRREIPWPLDDDCVIERDMFDEAQEAVYQLMRGHTFMRFEESKEWRECLRIKTEEPEIYQQHQITKSLEHYFRPNMNLMLAVTMSLDNEESAPALISHHYKEQTLHSILSQYFPQSILSDGTGKKLEIHRYSEILAPPALQGYFNSENRMTTAQRMRRIKKEKKLRWVFGEKLAKMPGQFNNVGGRAKELLLDDNEDATSVTSVLTANRKATRDVWNRKKKVEKLESIFGQTLKESQLYSQQIIKKEAPQKSNQNSSTVPSKKNSSTTIKNIDSVKNNPTSSSPTSFEFLTSNHDDGVHLTTINDLSAKDRRILWKKSQKLKLMLGEALDEELVRQTLALPTTNNAASIDNENYRSSGQYRKKLRRASDSMIPSTPSTSTQSPLTTPSSFYFAATSPQKNDSSNMNNRGHNKANRESGSWDASIRNNDYINRPHASLLILKDTKEYRRKKLQKLHQFLGEKVPVHVVLGQDDDYGSLPTTPTAIRSRSHKETGSNSLHSSKKQSISYQHQHNNNNVPATTSSTSNYDTSDQIHSPPVNAKLLAQDKKLHQKRAVKLKKMFGETPPQDLYISSTPVHHPQTPSPPISQSSSKRASTSSRLDIHRRSIMSLDYLFENDRKVMYELIDYMFESDDNEAESNLTNSTHNNDEINLNAYRHIASAPATPSTGKPSFSPPIHQSSPSGKHYRLKDIQNLSKFFGADDNNNNQMFPVEVLDELLADLEKEIREEANTNDGEFDREAIEGLIGKVKELRAKTNELHVDYYRDGGTSSNRQYSHGHKRTDRDSLLLN
ncbi:1337_t:CDS:2 [Ambispora leptoticha]|uniref:1337_t:CDS:1 n=1 Tax=Ambispora leptoticha TaxID=144679 RepID=A0A9N8V659_9GLOM|nr:1337_t:CDS:2 [Ambispora leptoticha]